MQNGTAEHQLFHERWDYCQRNNIQRLDGRFTRERGVRHGAVVARPFQEVHHPVSREVGQHTHAHPQKDARQRRAEPCLLEWQHLLQRQPFDGHIQEGRQCKRQKIRHPIDQIIQQGRIPAKLQFPLPTVSDHAQEAGLHGRQRRHQQNHQQQHPAQAAGRFSQTVFLLTPLLIKRVHPNLRIGRVHGILLRYIWMIVIGQFQPPFLTIQPMFK